ncbi:MAG TPA: hypothetical protein VK625_16900, partial [Flavitalea sp.]|nr:hypothetical protein [Flavitalea sp.]
MLKVSTLVMFVLMFVITGCGNNDKKQEASDNSNSKQDSTPITAVKTILFFGNSLTAGYGLDVSEAFPALIQAR